VRQAGFGVLEGDGEQDVPGRRQPSASAMLRAEGLHVPPPTDRLHHDAGQREVDPAYGPVLVAQLDLPVEGRQPGVAQQLHQPRLQVALGRRLVRPAVEHVEEHRWARPLGIGTSAQLGPAVDGDETVPERRFDGQLDQVDRG
jgi:hypothetical protein